MFVNNTGYLGLFKESRVFPFLFHTREQSGTKKHWKGVRERPKVAVL